MRHLPGLLPLVVVIALAHNVLAQPGPGRLPAGTEVVRDLAYVSSGHERHKLDLYLPAGVQRPPLVVWVHGGAWRAGSKENARGVVPLLEAKFAVASINYRLSQHAVFPAQLEDCKAAIRYLRANAETYGYDADRIGVWGASAGGHLVSLLGTTGQTREFDVGEHTDLSSRVQAVCSWFGPSDFLQMDEQAGGRGRLRHDDANSPESRLIGGPIRENPEKVRRANPITYIQPDAPPFLLMHGDQDFVVPLGQGELLHEALKEAGVQSTLVVVEGGGHGFGGPQMRELTSRVVEFFSTHLRDGTPRGETKRNQK